MRYLTAERDDRDNAIQQILLANHPVFLRFQKLTRTGYRVFFTDEEELNKWLSARQWTRVPEIEYDEGSFREWSKEGLGYISLTEEIFEVDGRLRVYTEETWNDDWLHLNNYREAEESPF